ncbi:phosphodiesterase [Candidatus Poribacteria bacterium]|nr:phosphodiesterase [Candidatus Poribacteria bacterium]
MFKRRKKIKKVLVIGWDCGAPQLVFDKYLDDMPNMKKLMDNGIYGEIESTIPAITCPAWMSMMTSKDPGTLGFYGFRNRPDHSYDGMSIANSTMVKENTVWDILSKHDKNSIIIGVPQTYPPKPLNGCMVTSFLTPSTESEYTYPPELKQEVERIADGYMLDVENFRTDDKAQIVNEIFEMTEKRHKVAKHLMTTSDWDFFMMVEMGPDRLHHGLWRFIDENHRDYIPTKYKDIAREYYEYLDEIAGDLIETAGEDTAVIVVSDHGVKPMDGGICINEWMIQEGYLKLKEYPDEVTRLASENIDWENTRAWGEGGYYARVFLNVKDREPRGIVPQMDYEKIRDELTEKLKDLGDDKGNPIGTKVFKPQDIYKVCKGIPPDLIIYFGDLSWRSVGSVGLKTIHTFENDTGPDDANHAQYGMFIMSVPNSKVSGKITDIHVMDCAPTILKLMNISIPDDMQGKVIDF